MQKCLGFCSVWLYKGTAVTCSHHSNTTIQTLFLGLCLQSLFTQTAFWVFSWQTDERELECKQEADLWIRNAACHLYLAPYRWHYYFSTFHSIALLVQTGLLAEYYYWTKSHAGWRLSWTSREINNGTKKTKHWRCFRVSSFKNINGIKSVFLTFKWSTV